jgi:hypothetical protein
MAVANRLAVNMAFFRQKRRNRVIFPIMPFSVEGEALCSIVSDAYYSLN